MHRPWPAFWFSWRRRRNRRICWLLCRLRQTGPGQGDLLRGTRLCIGKWRLREEKRAFSKCCFCWRAWRGWRWRRDRFLEFRSARPRATGASAATPSDGEGRCVAFVGWEARQKRWNCWCLRRRGRAGGVVLCRSESRVDSTPSRDLGRKCVC